MRGKRASRQRSRGFSLAESLVALVIAAGVISAYYQAVSTGLDLERRARARGEAALLAQDLVDQLGFEIALDAGATSGRDARGYAWRLAVIEGAQLVAGDGGSAPATSGLVQVEIAIEGADLPGGYRLVTLRNGAGTVR
jgi:prepilin-type N-terminal cleavage/methylation domain-containing protein